MNKIRCAIVIDGSNLYFKLKELNLQHLLEFDFSGFVKFISRNNEIMNSVYYVGAVRTDGTKRAQKMYKNQRKLFAHLRKHQFKYSLGYLLKSGGKMHEKGVDVNMAVDMLVAAYEDLCDHIILVSSDTDLLPAIRKAKEKGKTVEYIGFSHQPSLAMIANCTVSKLLAKEDLEPFLKNS